MKYNSIGEQLIAKAQELDPNYKPDKFNDMSEAIDVILNNSGSSGIPTANVNLETFQLDTSSLTNKDQYVLASMDEGEGNISYIPLQTYFFNAGYFNKEVKMQNYSGGFSLALSNISFSSANNYTLNAKNTNVDFTSSLDSSKTWNKKGKVKYIAIEEQNIFTGENTYDYLEIETAASNKIWFDVRAIGDVYLTEEQYNTLVSYAKNDLLAGINANGFFIPLQGISDIKSDKPTLTFEGWYLSIGLITITINAEDRKVDFNTRSVLMSPTTSLSSQVIPSIKTDGSQQNLTIGDGLKIENGALTSTLSNFKYGTLCLNNITQGDDTLNIELSFFDYIYDSIISGANQLLGTSLTRDTFPQYIKQNKSIDLIISLIDNTLTLIRALSMMPYFNITVSNDRLKTYFYNCPIKKDGSSISLFLGNQEMILNTSLTFDDNFTVEYKRSWYGD